MLACDAATAAAVVPQAGEELTYSCEFCRTKFPSYELAEAHEKACPLNPQAAAATAAAAANAAPLQEAMMMAMMAKGGGGMMGKMGPMMGKSALGMMGGPPGKGNAGMPGMGAEGAMPTAGLGGMMPGMAGGCDPSGCPNPGAAAMLAGMGAGGPGMMGGLGPVPGKGMLGMLGKGGPGLVPPPLLGKGGPGMLGAPGLVGGAPGLLGMGGMGPCGLQPPLQRNGDEPPKGAGDQAPGGLGTSSTLKDDPPGFEGLCEKLKDFRRKWDIELRFEPKIIEHLTKQDSKWKEELERLDKELIEAQVPPVCRSGYLLVVFGTVTEANTDEDFRKILCPNLVKEEKGDADPDEKEPVSGGGGGASNGRAAVPAAAGALPEEWMDTQVQEFCGRFSIDEPLKNRLVAALQNRLGTFKEDMNTLMSALKAARHPPGLLSLRLREMENGTFQTRGWLPAEESNRSGGAERARSRSRERRRERSRSRERKRERSRSKERRRRSRSRSRRKDDRGDRGDRAERSDRGGERGGGEKADRDRDRDRARHAKEEGAKGDRSDAED